MESASGENMTHCYVEIPKYAENFIEKILSQLKEHDQGTYEHCKRVSNMCLELAKEMNLNILDQAVVMYAGLLHDVGKLQVPTEIINKPERLTEAEYEIMKMHTKYGVDLIQPLTKLNFFQKVSQAILYHHERIDGNGYFRISEEKIPIHSKIILVVDTVDAMTEDRAYRKGLSMQTALDELVRCSGTQFDPSIVDCYLDLHNRTKVPAATRKAA